MAALYNENDPLPNYKLLYILSTAHAHRYNIDKSLPYHPIYMKLYLCFTKT